MRRADPRLGRSDRRGERGAALLVVITAIAIMTAVAVDLAYNTRVSVQLAANARDELRATYLAKSALNVSRLVLNFQQQLDRTSGAVAGALATPAGGAPKSATQAGAQNPQSGNPLAGVLGGLGGLSIRLWELVPIDSSAAALFLSGGGGAGAGPGAVAQPASLTSAPGAGGVPPPPGAAGEGARRAFGEFEGSFHATIEDEDRKVNIRQLNALAASGRAGAQALRLAQLCRDPKYDFLFDTDDANGIRVSRLELFAALKDWQDEDETGSAFTGDPVNPFQNGYGDENAHYDRLQDRYKAKNAAFDSLDELYMVAGVSDAFMAAFGDKVTVYPSTESAINVNTSEPLQLMVNTLIMSDPPGVPQPATADPAFLQKLQLALALMRPMPFMSITPQQFVQVLQGLGVKVGTVYTQQKNTDNRNPFGDKSTTFHIRAVGTAGDVKKTIDAVVTFDRRAGGLANDVGRLLHWREE